MLLNTDGRLKGILPMNPLPKDSAFNKSLKQKPKALPSGMPTFKPWKPAQPARFVPCKPAQLAKIVMQKPKAKFQAFDHTEAPKDESALGTQGCVSDQIANLPAGITTTRIPFALLLTNSHASN